MVDFNTQRVDSVQGFLDYVYGFYKSMVANKVNLVYEGEITHQITKAFTSLTESRMALEDESNNTQKKVFHVMVECLQNISKHADSLDEESTTTGSGRGIFIVMRDHEEYVVTTGNVIANEKVPELQRLLSNINTMDKEGLKDLYKTQIREGRISEKGGAGLGFIDIARKTGNPLTFNFLDINENFSFFVLTSKISREV